jgi:hypothetical protein
MLHSRLTDRVTHLTRQHGVFQKEVMGAYNTQPLRGSEFLLHETAHWIGLGNSVDSIPRRLSRKVSDIFESIPVTSADSLEIDASMVTFLAGYQLGLWTDPNPIVRSCRRNLRGSMAFGDDSEVLERFHQRWSHFSSRSYRSLAKSLALWFHPKARLLPTTDITFGV